MATEKGTDSTSPLDRVMEDIPQELVRRVAAEDRDGNRDIHNALEDEYFTDPSIGDRFSPFRPVRLYENPQLDAISFDSRMNA